MSGHAVQFGTSRLLQAHVDLFVHEARQCGQNAGPIIKTNSCANDVHKRYNGVELPEEMPA